MERESALIIVDVQNDFCPGGSLAVPGGDEIIPLINRYIRIFREQNLPVLVTRDWHPPATVHFITGGGIWPVHCVQGTEGAQFHPRLELPEEAIILSKGLNPDIDDSYSAFKAVTGEGRPALAFLRETGIIKLYLCGMATDFCVRSTALDALGNGIAVTILKDAVRGVDLHPGDSERAISEMVAAGAAMEDITSLKES